MSPRNAFESYAEFVDQTGKHGMVAFAKWAKLCDVKTATSKYTSLSKAAESKRPGLYLLMWNALVSEGGPIDPLFRETAGIYY
jgi:hypothetical protein